MLILTRFYAIMGLVDAFAIAKMTKIKGENLVPSNFYDLSNEPFTVVVISTK
jgi:hypothetical protein